MKGRPETIYNYRPLKEADGMVAVGVWRGGPRGERIKRGSSRDMATDWMDKEGRTL